MFAGENQDRCWARALIALTLIVLSAAPAQAQGNDLTLKGEIMESSASHGRLSRPGDASVPNSPSIAPRPAVQANVNLNAAENPIEKLPHSLKSLEPKLDDISLAQKPGVPTPTLRSMSTEEAIPWENWHRHLAEQMNSLWTSMPHDDATGIASIALTVTRDGQLSYKVEDCNDTGFVIDGTNCSPYLLENVDALVSMLKGYPLPFPKGSQRTQVIDHVDLGVGVDGQFDWTHGDIEYIVH